MFLIKTALGFVYVGWLAWLSMTIGFSPTLHAAVSSEVLMITWMIMAFGPAVAVWMVSSLFQKLREKAA